MYGKKNLPAAGTTVWPMVWSKLAGTTPGRMICPFGIKNACWLPIWICWPFNWFADAPIFGMNNASCPSIVTVCICGWGTTWNIELPAFCRICPPWMNCCGTLCKFCKCRTWGCGCIWGVKNKRSCFICFVGVVSFAADKTCTWWPSADVIVWICCGKKFCNCCNVMTCGWPAAAFWTFCCA